MEGNFRPIAVACVINSDNKILICRSVHTGKWQCPQGGIEKGESARAAAFRELHEETGIIPSKVKLIQELPEWLYYSSGQFEMDDEVYDGQKAKWFLLQFVGHDGNIDLATDPNDQEFNQFKWETSNTILPLVPSSKRKMYRTALAKFKSHLTPKGLSVTNSTRQVNSL